MNTIKTELGIVCDCGSAALRTLRTTREHGYIVRRRKCRVCGQRMTTTERPVNDAPPNVTATCSALLQFSIGQIQRSLELLTDPAGGTVGEPQNSRHELSEPTRRR